MSAAQRTEQNQKLCSHLAQWLPGIQSNQSERLIIAAYWPLADEPDITPVLHTLDKAGHAVVLPVVAKRSTPLEFHLWSPGAEMTAGNFGVMEPSRKKALQPDIMLIPTLGYTAKGDRLGYGGGYYDRTLAEMRNKLHTPLTIGIGWSEGLLTRQYPDYQPEPNDVPLHVILSAEGWIPAKPKTLTGHGL